MNYRTWRLILYVVIVDIFEFATCVLSCLYRVEGVRGIVQLEEFFLSFPGMHKFLGSIPVSHRSGLVSHIYNFSAGEERPTWAA